MKEVSYDLYCELCKYKDLEEFKDPCNDCLDTPSREGTHIPIRWEGKDRATTQSIEERKKRK